MMTGRLERATRSRQLNPQKDAEKYIKLKTDKAGLSEHFINSYKGRGVFAQEIFKQGDFLLEYRGQLFQRDLHRKNFNETESVFLFDFDWKGKCWCVAASVEDKSLGRLVNDEHRKPNCRMKTIDVAGIPHLCLFALRDIAPGDEITYNYGDADWPWRKEKKLPPDVSEQIAKDKNRSQLNSQSLLDDDTDACIDGIQPPPPSDTSTPDGSMMTSDSLESGAAVTITQLNSQSLLDDDTDACIDGIQPPPPSDTSTPDGSMMTSDSLESGAAVTITQEKSPPDVVTQIAKDSERFQSRMSKLRQHHEACLNRHNIAEEERNAKERQRTMNLLKRAQLTQQLAELDAFLNSQSLLDDDTDACIDGIQPPPPSDTSTPDGSMMTSDSLESGAAVTITQLNSQSLLDDDTDACIDGIQPPPPSDTSTPDGSMMTSDSLESGAAVTITQLNSQSLLDDDTDACIDGIQPPPPSDTSTPDGSMMTSDSLESGAAATITQATSYMESSLDESDHTNYSDIDYVPDTEGSSSEEDTPLLPIAKKTMDSLKYPTLTPTKLEINSEISLKRNLNSQRKRNIVFPSPSKSTPRKSRFQHLKDALRVMPPINSETRRVYDKKNYCLFCLKPISKIARHLEAVHGDEAEVATVFQYAKNSKQRRDKLNTLRRRGNFAQNAIVLREGAGELQACYRPRECRRAIDFIHCFYCQGLYSKKTLWKHMKICPAKPDTSEESSTGKVRVRSKCALKTAIVRDIGEGLKSVISCMNYDEVTQIIQNDQLLLQFGQHLFDLNGSRKNRHDHIRQRLRELGRLLLVAKQNTPIRKAVELIYPANFNHLISSVRKLAGYNQESNTFFKPSLALKIGNSLGIISELVESDNLSTVDRDQSLLEFAREFNTIKKFRWKGLITRGATTTLRESKWNAPQIIPFTEDIKRMDAHMENVNVVAERMLRLCPSANNYTALAKVTLAQLIIFNRRREGEVSRMELATFKARKKSEPNDDMAACLTPLENKMCHFFTRVEIRGKRGRGVPVLLKPSMVSAMELLAETREKCGVPKENIYMFARPGALSAYRGGECIKKFAIESGAKHPEALTSTKLRKHIATMSQVLNLQENEADQLADFLGHDIRVHRQYYRLPAGTLQLAKMSKVLLAVEKGTLSQYKGQSLDDIEIDPEEKLDSSQEQDTSSDEEIQSTAEGSADNGHEAPLPSSSTSAPLNQENNRGNSKRKWEDSEVHAVERHMMRFIQSCKVPRKIDCIRCINAEPGALKDRSWTGLKNYVRNRITVLKRNSCGKES